MNSCQPRWAELDCLIGTYCCSHPLHNGTWFLHILKFWRLQNEVLTIQKHLKKNEYIEYHLIYIFSVRQNVGNHVNFPQHYFMVSVDLRSFDVLDAMGEYPSCVHKKLTFHTLLSSAFHSGSCLCNQQLSLQERRWQMN